MKTFIGVAYRFEAEFAHRWLNAGYQIEFEPAAVIDHLKVSRGGTREYGEHLTTMRPYHAVGAYYYLLTTGRIRKQAKGRIFRRFVESIKTRHHLKHPWYIPVTLIAEIRGLHDGASGWLTQGPRHINSDTSNPG